MKIAMSWLKICCILQKKNSYFEDNAIETDQSEAQYEQKNRLKYGKSQWSGTILGVLNYV